MHIPFQVGGWNDVDEKNLGFAEPRLEDSVKQQRLSFTEVRGNKDQLGTAPTDNGTLRHHPPHNADQVVNADLRECNMHRKRTMHVDRQSRSTQKLFPCA
jgi:hypothetical protein